MIDVPPPPAPSFSEDSFSHYSFNPGYWKQDVFTLPLEIFLIASINNYYTTRTTSLWPFTNETANLKPLPTTLPREKLFPYSLGVATLILGGLSFSQENFAVGSHIRGWLHAQLLTEVATSSAKIIFQRKRPFYDYPKANNEQNSDDNRFSFFSGHASHAFAFASYSSLLLFQYSKSDILNWSYAIFAHSTAAWVAQSRVTDHAHNVSDVVIGGIVGATVAASVFFRVEKVQEILQKKNSKLNLEVYPFVYNDDTKKTWYGANVSFHL
jgi:membrane-associated phospholipid phosphatase